MRISIPLVHLDVLAEAVYNGLLIPLGLLTRLGMVGILKVALNHQQGADSVKKLDDEPPSVIGEHIRRGVVRMYPMVQKRVDASCGRVVQSGTEQTTLENRSMISKINWCSRYVFGDSPRKFKATSSRRPAAGNRFNSF